MESIDMAITPYSNKPMNLYDAIDIYCGQHKACDKCKLFIEHFKGGMPTVYDRHYSKLVKHCIASGMEEARKNKDQICDILGWTLINN